MWSKLAKMRLSSSTRRILSGVLLSGLCATALAITTDSPVNSLTARSAGAATAMIVAAADTSSNHPLALEPQGASGAAAVSSSATRIALLLPAHSSLFGPAADAVRTGFLTAYENDKQGVTVNLVESGDTPAEMVRTYIAALGDNDIIVGPLSRTGAAAIVQSGRVDKPTVTLTQPEGDDLVLPAKMLVIALAVEEEARQVANWTESDKTGGRIFAISTGTAWQRRAVKAFLAQSKALGMAATPLEISATAGGSILIAIYCVERAAR
jgi:outer membrane PBP1 activator LpoA protein